MWKLIMIMKFMHFSGYNVLYAHCRYNSGVFILINNVRYTKQITKVTITFKTFKDYLGVHIYCIYTC